MFEMGVPKKKKSATMGSPNGHYKHNPKNYLKKKENLLHLPPTKLSNTYIHILNMKFKILFSKGDKKVNKEKIKPDLPGRKSKPLMGLVTDKNYIKSNIIEAKVLEPKKVSSMTNWIRKKDFGKIPFYLKNNKSNVKNESKNEEVEEVQSISKEEREELLKHLKMKWASVNTEYQKMTFTLDTPAKIKRKETYENMLQEIETDIKTLEKGDVIYIID